MNWPHSCSGKAVFHSFFLDARHLRLASVLLAASLRRALPWYWCYLLAPASARVL